MRAGVVGWVGVLGPAFPFVAPVFDDGAEEDEGAGAADEDAEGEAVGDDALSDPSVTSPPLVHAASAKVKRAAPKTRFD